MALGISYSCQQGPIFTKRVDSLVPNPVSGKRDLASEFSNRSDDWFVTGLLDEKWKAMI